jgi:hypothetical protein
MLDDLYLYPPLKGLLLQKEGGGPIGHIFFAHREIGVGTKYGNRRRVNLFYVELICKTYRIHPRPDLVIAIGALSQDV